MADVVAPTPDAAGAEHKYQFNVTMSCGGCSGAVERVLKKLEGASTIVPPRPPGPCCRSHPSTLLALLYLPTSLPPRCLRECARARMDESKTVKTAG